MEYAQFPLAGWLVGFLLVLIWLWNSLYVIKEWERGVVLRLGRMLPEAKSAGVRVGVLAVWKLFRSLLRVVNLRVPPAGILTRGKAFWEGALTSVYPASHVE